MLLEIGAEEESSPRLLEGKTYSILGDSISTYTNVSSGKAADTTNSTIRGGAVHYTPGKWDGVYLEDTWWVQLEEITGLRRLVNNSWSGSAVFAERVGTVGGYIDRCVQLHDDTGENAGEEPDIIFVFLGTNDFSYYQDQLFAEGGIDYDKLIVKTADGYTYAEPTSVVEAYAIMIHKITVRYPDSELYCFSMMARRDTNKDKVPQPIEFNAELKAISDRYGAIYVDLYDIGIPSEDGIFDRYFPDLRVHPGVLGMDNVTSAVWTSMLHNSRFIPKDTELCEVTSVLEGATSTSPPVMSVVKGDSYESKLMARSHYAIDVKVTMGGVDITSDCYADGKIFIEKVTGDVRIEAKEYFSYEGLNSYRWEFINGENLGSVNSGGNTVNKITQTAGEITNGTFSKVQYELDTEIMLFHNLPWTVEWCSEGTFKNASANGGLLLSPGSDNVPNAPYIFKCEKSIVAIGVSSGSYHNYGIKLSDHGIDAAARHIYRLQNKIAEDGSNMVYLYVDGVEIGPMIHHYQGTNDTGETSDWLSGKDIFLGYMGTKNHPLTNCSIEYLQIWEMGAPGDEPEPDPHVHSYTTTVIEPTCTKQGYILYSCECGYGYIADGEDATGHSYAETVTEPTCTDKGFTTHKCEVCGDSYVDAHSEATGHVYDREILSSECVRSEATYDSAAVFYKSCACGAIGEETFEYGKPLERQMFASVAVWSIVVIIFIAEIVMLAVLRKIRKEINLNK